MKHVNGWADLRPHGLDLLTGEACGLSMRFLVDCTEKGRKLLATTFGIPDLNLGEPWNGGRAEEPHVGSLLVPPQLFTTLAVFALLESGCVEAWVTRNGRVLGVEPADPPDGTRAMEGFLKDDLARRYAYRGTAGSRNLHVFTGRTE